MGDLLPLSDFAAVLLAAYFATMAFTAWVAPGVPAVPLLAGVGNLALVGAFMAPLILCDRGFLRYASSGHSAAMVRCYVVRFLMFGGIFLLIGGFGGLLAGLPMSWLALWCAVALLLTAAVRGTLVLVLRRLERKGVLSETVAVVGAGADADELIALLRGLRFGRAEVVGLFDDIAERAPESRNPITGTVSELIAMGASRPIDWILIAQGALTEQETQAVVRRLRALAVPVGLWSAADGAAFLGAAASPATGLPAATAGGLQAQQLRPSLQEWAELVLPPWIPALLGRVGDAVRAITTTALRRRAPAVRKPTAERLTLTLDGYTQEAFVDVARGFGQENFGFVVTPNADHLQRLHREPAFRALYAEAAYVLLDSRFVSHCLRLTRGLRLPVCTGSDLTAALFSEVVDADDGLVVVGGSAQQAERLRQIYGLTKLAHYNPPMGFVHDAAAVERCLQFVEAHSPFRFCLLAVGAPQQEMLAQQLGARGSARGMALCIGASINFLTGGERRAPRWMQRAGLEWLFRLLLAPRRMAGRYLMRGPRLFNLLRRTEVVLRSPQRTLSPLRVSVNTPVAARPNYPGPFRLSGIMRRRIGRMTTAQPKTGTRQRELLERSAPGP